MRPKTFALIAAAALTLSAAAQTPPEANGPVIAHGEMMAMHLESNMDAAPVKGAPFCANISTEHTQQFADGNRIHSTENSTLCRDSEGRTRRDAGLNLLGAGGDKPASKLITIVDPVAGARYVLDPDNKIAHKMSPLGPGGVSMPDLPPKGEHMMVFHTSGTGEAGMVTNDVFYKKVGTEHEPAHATENLGDQTINGIHATGTRMTHTIPAGKMGNDKPIMVTSERWYSPELKATVMTKHNDPWAGELKTEFTSVNTSEPDASLFTVPSDYRVIEDKDGPIKIQLPAPAPPQ